MKTTTTRLKTSLQTIAFAIRHGQWSWGWEDWKGKPRLGVASAYYDGHHWSLHVYKLWLQVVY